MLRSSGLSVYFTGKNIWVYSWSKIFFRG